MEYPENDRTVLTIARDENGTEFWQLDDWDETYQKWYKAAAWGHDVVEWYELPKREVMG